LEKRGKAFPSFRGIGNLKIKGIRSSKAMRIAWIGSEPGNLRLEMLGMWGQPLATFLLKEPTFCLYIVKDNLCYKGKSTARNLFKMLNVYIESEDLFAVMSGHPPIPTHRKAKVRASKGGTTSTLSLFGPWNRIIQKMWFSDTPKTIERVESFDSLGDMKYTIVFSNFKNNGGYLVPYEIQIVQPHGAEILLNIEKFQNGISIPDKAFELNLRDAKVIELDS
jgi:hypothetical protein